jgi:predicted ATP-dependent serine protease
MQSNYKVRRVKDCTSTKNLSMYKSRLKIDFPQLIDCNIEGFKIIGKTGTKNQFVAKKEGKLLKINLLETTVTVEKKEVDLSNMNIETVKLKDLSYDPNLFIPIKSNTALDFCFSQKGGVMPATNYIIIGDPGIGKSSISIQFAADIKEQNPDKKVLFISAEMTEWDMIPYTERFPLWSELDILFTSKLTDGIYKESLEQKLKEGWDLVLVDSFSELADTIRGDINENCQGKDKKSYNDIEKYLVDLMVTHNGANNDLNLNTSFLSIQQVTKGGQFVGSNKLKHNTTGMLEIRYNKGKERVINVSKNRRGNEYQDLVFTFSEDLDKDPIQYDIARIERDKLIQNEISKIRDMQLEEETLTDKWIDFKRDLETV